MWGSPALFIERSEIRLCCTKAAKIMFLFCHLIFFVTTLKSYSLITIIALQVPQQARLKITDFLKPSKFCVSRLAHSTITFVSIANMADIRVLDSPSKVT